MTLRTNGKSWNQFERWCQARKLKPLPAHAWTLCAFVRWCEPRHDYLSIVAATKAVARRHLISGHRDPERHPMVQRTLAMIARRISSQHQRSSLFDDEAFGKNNEDARDMQEPLAQPKESRSAKRVLRAMRSTPKLVSRRR